MRLRRRSEAQTPVDEQGSADDAARGGEGPAADPPASDGAVGPYDVDDLPDDDVERVDLGSLLIAPEQGRELRLQVDESTGAVASVILAGSDGAVDLRAFAAPRNGDLWSDIRPQIAADMAKRGGTATEREGRFGTELVCQLPVERPEGGTAVQPSRIIGINGPRWLLRATLLGKPAIELETATEWEDTVTAVAVRRGSEAMPVGEPLPVVMPENARRVDPSGSGD